VQDPATTLPVTNPKPDRLPLGAGLGYVVLLAVFTVLVLYLFHFDVFSIEPGTLKLALGVMSLVILMNLANAYLYAYKFYEDLFFLFISTGWFANALYLVFEFFSTPETLASREAVFLLGMIANTPFFLSVFTQRRGRVRYRLLVRSALLWAVLLVASPIAANLLSNRFELSDAYRFMIFALGGIVFSAWLLFSVGSRLRERLDVSIHGRGAIILPWTFYFYAALQLTYVCALIPGWTSNMFFGAFVVAFLLKVVNSISVISILAVTRREFVQIKTQLEQRSVLEEIGRIASSIEHDIKTPLGIMSFEIGRMLRKFQSNSEIVEALQRIEDERKRVFAISQVVPYLRGDREFYERYMEKTDALEVVHKAIRNVKKDMKLDPSKFYFKVTGRDMFIKCHRSMLEQALVNVLKNSVEAVNLAKRKSGVVEICLSRRKQERFVNIEVKDNGCGIAEQDIPSLTTLYTTKAHLKPNSGIGLFIVEKIIRMHEGSIDISSELGQGTAVRILLPEWIDPLPVVDHQSSSASADLSGASA